MWLTGRRIGVIAILVILLGITVSYLNYTDYSTNMRERGAYTVAFSGKAYLQGGEVIAVIDELRPQYTNSPTIPSYIDWLFSGWGGRGHESINSSGATVFTVRLILVMTEPDGVDHELVDKKFDAKLEQFGAVVDWDYALGPYLADEDSPLKFDGKVYIDGELRNEVIEYLVLPMRAPTGE